jgi:hypothetical protein
MHALIGSARAFEVGDGAPAPTLTPIVRLFFVDLGLDRLAFHRTMIDTAIAAKETDKGTGLAALRDWVLEADAETIAIHNREQIAVGIKRKKGFVVK